MTHLLAPLLLALAAGPDERAALARELAAARAAVPAGDARAADAEVFLKAAAWALRFEPDLSPADAARVRVAVGRGRARAAALAAGMPRWPAAKGRVARGFVSAIDGSVQPYGVVVPAGYDPARPIRLDVVLHGSSLPRGLSELNFLDAFDKGDAGGDAPAADYIELHPLGRVENGYRWAGEADVFEAIEAACREYAVDRRRVVLRGMSMGGSGTWHLGLKHPDRFAALAPYAGYVDTRDFSRLPYAHFVPVGDLPPVQDRGLRLLDSVGYAANAGLLPVVAAAGAKDPTARAHALMAAAAAREGVTYADLTSPDTGHVVDPRTHAEQMKLVAAAVAAGRDPAPRRVRFVTHSLKYARCDWLEVLGLGEHYARAEVDARLGGDGAVEVSTVSNVTRFAVRPPALARLRVAGADVALPAGARGAVVGKRDGGWTYLGEPGRYAPPGKRPGSQGPIDDAFTGPFLCVRGTGTPHHPAVAAWADARLARFAEDWARYFRGELPVKDDTAVTAADVAGKHLVLFGDPSSNPWVAKVVAAGPVGWTRDEVRVGDARWPAAGHAPVFIRPSPLPGAAGRYVVVNSGHTFGAKELGTLNYLLFPRLGDWAVLRTAGPAGEVARADFFGEDWEVVPRPGR